MALYAFWMFLTLCPFLAHSESGDDAPPDTECFSTLSLVSSLTCHLAEEDIDDFEYATLCENNCQNGTLENNSFSFHNLNTLQSYFLKTFFKDGVENQQDINLVKIVKIPTPMVYNASFNFEQAQIFIKYTHGYVTNPCFQVEIWGPGVKDKMCLTVEYQPVTIGVEKLRNSDVYNVRVRAKPVKYFDGNWTDWSPTISFTVKHSSNDPTYVTYIILCTSLILVIGIGLVVLRWKEEIQAYITPNIPNPKATLAQIHREKEHPPVSFSPEIFSDININRVDYAEEKQLVPESDEGQKDSTGSCESETQLSRCSWPASQCEEQDEDDRRIEAEMSHLKIRLLDRLEEEEVGLATLQRDCRDETYVTMSSLYKTQ